MLNLLGRWAGFLWNEQGSFTLIPFYQFAGYNKEDVNSKFSKLSDKGGDNDIDVINNKLADLGRVSIIDF